MHYIISDIHGCYQEYKQLLEKIHFSDEDELYVLGDAVDRGPQPISVLLDMMLRPNCSFIMGNHEAMLLSVLPKFTAEVTENSIRDLTVDDMLALQLWQENGGDTTIKQFRQLDHEMQQCVLDYISDALPYEMIECNHKLYLLVHAGLSNFSPDRELEEYQLDELIWERSDYSRRYFPGERVILVTGHTPTMYIRPDQQPLICEENGQIALDCGCVFGGQLAAYCIESGETIYVSSRSPGSDAL